MGRWQFFSLNKGRKLFVRLNRVKKFLIVVGMGNSFIRTGIKKHLMVVEMGNYFLRIV